MSIVAHKFDGSTTTESFVIEVPHLWLKRNVQIAPVNERENRSSAVALMKLPAQNLFTVFDFSRRTPN